MTGQICIITLAIIIIFFFSPVFAKTGALFKVRCAERPKTSPFGKSKSLNRVNNERAMEKWGDGGELWVGLPRVYFFFISMIL